MYNQIVDFKEWINAKYIEWRGNSRQSVSEFAQYLDISQQVLDKWLNRGSVPSTRTLPKLAARYPDVYEVLGLPSPDDGLDELGPEFARSFRSARSKTLSVLRDKGISAVSPEGKEIMKRIFSEFGITLNEIE